MIPQRVVYEWPLQINNSIRGFVSEFNKKLCSSKCITDFERIERFFHEAAQTLSVFSLQDRCYCKYFITLHEYIRITGRNSAELCAKRQKHVTRLEPITFHHPDTSIQNYRTVT